MLEYRLLDEGRRAGLTSSPDFLRTSGGLTLRLSSSSLSSDVCMGDSVKSGLTMLVAVEDLECEILRASGERAVGDVMVVVGSERVLWCSAPPAWRIRTGDGSLFNSIDRTACSNSPHVRRSSSAFVLGLSSPSEFSEESGGDMTAPVGINRLFNGGGD